MEVIRKMRGRLASENGSVGVVVALVIFLVMGMLTMTWNTAQLSKAKMRLQNAADSAALAHAMWQARGMNAVQNINDEMYEGLSLAVKLRAFGEGFEIAAQVCDGLANTPYIGWIFKGIAVALHTIGVLSAGVGGWLGARICSVFLKYLAMIYAKISSILGIWNAQQLAAQNDADPLATFGKYTFLGYEWNLGLYTLWASHPFKDSFMLPLDESGKDEVKKSPWKVDEIETFKTAQQPWKFMYELAGSAKAWEVKPYVSKRGDKEGIKVTKEKKDGKETTKVETNGVFPGTTIWLAFKLGQNIHTLPIDGFWNPGNSKKFMHRTLPVFAVAAAQCVTGDVIPHSKKTEEDTTNQRPAGFGAGATAKLVPVSQMVYDWKKTLGYAVDAIIYH